MTVRMKRDPEIYQPPYEAYVHPDEVENWRAGGWVLADPFDHDGDGRPGGSLPRGRPRKKGA